MNESCLYMRIFNISRSITRKKQPLFVIFIKAEGLSILAVGKREQIKGKATLVFFLFNVVLNHVMLKFNSSKNN